MYIDETNKRKQEKPSALASGASFRRFGVGIVIEKINSRESATIRYIRVEFLPLQSAIGARTTSVMIPSPTYNFTDFVRYLRSGWGSNS